MLEASRGSGEGTQSATLSAPAFEMSDHATYNHASASRTIRITDGSVSDVSWDEGDYLGISCSIKARAHAESLYFKHT